MGVMYDYFAAPSDEAAAATIDQPGGPGTGPRLPMPFKDLVAQYGMDRTLEFLKPQLYLSDRGFHVVSTKGFDPVADLGALAALLTGHDLDADYHVIADRDGGERLVTWISDGTREALEHATDDALAVAARRWVQDQAQWRTIDPDPVTHLLTQHTQTALPNLATGQYRLINKHSGEFMEIPGASTTVGRQAGQWVNTANNCQLWTFTANSGGSWTVKNVNSGLFLDNNGSTSAGAAVVQNSSSTANDQKWTLTDAGCGYFKLVNVASGLVADVASASTANGALIVQSSDTGADDELFSGRSNRGWV